MYVRSSTGKLKQFGRVRGTRSSLEGFYQIWTVSLSLVPCTGCRLICGNSWTAYSYRRKTEESSV